MCGPAPEIENALADNNNASLWANITYKCHHGYRTTVPDVTMYMTCSRNEKYFWNGTATACESN